MSNPVSSQDKYVGESGKPFNFSSLWSYYSPYTSPVVIQSSPSNNTTYQQILAEAKSFFDKNVNRFDEHNRFFERFIAEWIKSLRQDKYNHAELIWKSVLHKALSWEKSRSNRIHKGAPYYYWGVTCILKDDLEKGFLLMHQALEEDKKSASYIKFQDTPSYSFVTLNYQQQKQFFYYKVQQIALFLENQLNRYRSNRSGSLTLADFKSRLLSTPDYNLLDIVFHFIFDLFHSYKIENEYNLNLTNNAFGFITMVNVIFSLCLVIDNLNVYKNSHLRGQRFPVVVNPLVSLASLNFSQNIMERFNEPFQINFSNTISSLITSTALPKLPPIRPSSIEEDLLFVYGFRNFGAHRIENQPIVNTYFKEILGRIFNALFFTIEYLY